MGTKVRPERQNGVPFSAAVAVENTLRNLDSYRGIERRVIQGVTAGETAFLAMCNGR